MGVQDGVGGSGLCWMVWVVQDVVVVVVGGAGWCDNVRLVRHGACLCRVMLRGSGWCGFLQTDAGLCKVIAVLMVQSCLLFS